MLSRWIWPFCPSLLLTIQKDNGKYSFVYLKCICRYCHYSRLKMPSICIPVAFSIRNHIILPTYSYYFSDLSENLIIKNLLNEIILKNSTFLPQHVYTKPSVSDSLYCMGILYRGNCSGAPNHRCSEVKLVWVPGWTVDWF